MPNYTESEKSNIVYDEPGSFEGWFKGWFNKPWFGKGKGAPSCSEPSKPNVTYTKPDKGS